MKKIKDFLAIYPKRNTQGVYRSGIYNFFDCISGEKIRKGARASEEEAAAYESLAETYFTDQRDHMQDMLKFAAYLHGRPPTGARAMIAGTREFLGNYGVEFTQRQLKQMATKMPKGKSARTAEKDFDTESLRKILNHLDLKGKCVLLVLASSGMRIGELLSVDLSDVDMTTTPAEIVIRGENTKTGDTRTVFISSEAAEAVNEWLKIRDDYLASSINRNAGLIRKNGGAKKDEADTRLLPFSDTNVRELWENALKKTALNTKDNTTGRLKYRVHGLRKFFRSQLALTCPIDITECLLGHEGYLTDAYRRYSLKQMAEYYLKAEHHITITGSGDIREIQDRLQDTQAAVKGYKDLISEQAVETAELREKFERMEGELEAMKVKDKSLTEDVTPILEIPKVQAAIIEALKENPEIMEKLLRRKKE